MFPALVQQIIRGEWFYLFQIVVSSVFAVLEGDSVLADFNW